MISKTATSTSYRVAFLVGLKSVSCPPATARFSTAASKMKRTATTAGDSKAKKRRVELPEYHATPSMRTEDGDVVWPAPQNQIEAAKDFILEW